MGTRTLYLIFPIVGLLIGLQGAGIGGAVAGFLFGLFATFTLPTKVELVSYELMNAIMTAAVWLFFAIIFVLIILLVVFIANFWNVGFGGT
jgi:hypothetical protein